MNNTEVLHQPFSFETHAEEFVNYLEVIIRPDGTVEYAVPSHQDKLKAVGIEVHGQQAFLEQMNCDEAWANYEQWLCDFSGCVSVWNDFCVKPKKYTMEQHEALKKLSQTEYKHMPGMKLYRGIV